jgi:ABC-type multidrug transport system ATPase subunit
MTLQFEDVTFQYSSGRRVAERLSFDFAPGQVTVLRGPNGAGKTTILRLAAGLLRPSKGSVKRSGRLVHIPSSIFFHESLTVDEEIRYLAAAGDTGIAEIRASLTRWGFDASLLGAEISSLSTGWRQRLAFALAEQANGQCVLLDEPFANLDAEASTLLTAWIRTLVSSGAVVILAQHGSLLPLAGLPLEVLDVGRAA